MDFKIVNIKDSAEEWDNYLSKAENSTFFHTSSWLNLVEDVFEVEPIHILINTEKNKLLFPMFLKEKSLYSPFYSDYGGPCITDNTDENTIIDMFVYLEKIINLISKEKKANRIYIRPNFMDSWYVSNLNNESYRTSSKHVTYFLSNLNDMDDLLYLFHKKTRNAIRKALKYNVSVEQIQPNEKEKMLTYYKLHLKTKKKQGASPLPYTFFQGLSSNPPENILMYLAKYKQTYLAGLLSFVYNKIIYVFDNCSDSIYSQYNSNYALYYSLIQHAKDENFDVDFGRTSINDENLKRFKSRWGGEPKEYCTYMKIVPPVLINTFKIGIEYGKQHGFMELIRKF